MDKGKADGIGGDDNLAYPGTDRPSALLVKVNQAVPAGDLGGRWSNGRNYISEFPDDVAQLGLKVLKVFLDGMC